MSFAKNPLDAVVFPYVKFPIKKTYLIFEVMFTKFLCDISMLNPLSLIFFKIIALFFWP